MYTYIWLYWLEKKISESNTFPHVHFFLKISMGFRVAWEWQVGVEDPNKFSSSVITSNVDVHEGVHYMYEYIHFRLAWIQTVCNIFLASGSVKVSGIMRYISGSAILHFTGLPAFFSEIKIRNGSAGSFFIPSHTFCDLLCWCSTTTFIRPKQIVSKGDHSWFSCPTRN